MDISTQSSLLAAITVFAIALSVLLRGPRNRRYFLFATFGFSIFLWYTFNFLVHITQEDTIIRLRLIAAILIPIPGLRFFADFVALSRERRAELRRGAWAGAIVCSLLILSPWHQTRPVGAAVATYTFLILYMCIFLLHRHSRTSSSPHDRLRLRYLAVAGGVAVSAELMDLLIGTAMGSVITMIYMYYLSQFLLTTRLLDLNEIMGRGVVVGILALVLASIYGILVIWVENRPDLFLFNTLVASFVILILFEPLRAKVEEKISLLMFRAKHEFKVHLEGLRWSIASAIEVGDLVDRMLRGLEASQRITHASIYLIDQDGRSYRLAGHVGARPQETLFVAQSSNFLKELSSRGILTAESLEGEFEEARGQSQEDRSGVEALRGVLDTMDSLRARVSLPIASDDIVLAILNLQDERVREAYSSGELAILAGLAAQAAITLQNSRIYERLKERDRLAALGEMATGLAHEIRNPLGAIKAAAQYLSGDRSEEAEEFLGIIVEEVNRLNVVVTQFLNYARPYRGDSQEVRINEVLHRVARMVEAEAQGVRVVLDLRENVTVSGDPEMLKQVFLNLAQNALHAMPEGGELTISTRTRPSVSVLKGAARGRQRLDIHFMDTGVGISEEQLKRIFIPFFTTRPNGTGLGLPISQRIVENHGGQVEVRSQIGQGSDFIVTLPLGPGHDTYPPLLPASEAGQSVEAGEG